VPERRAERRTFFASGAVKSAHKQPPGWFRAFEENYDSGRISAGVPADSIPVGGASFVTGFAACAEHCAAAGAFTGQPATATQQS
jgi:hypothetical protein